MEEVIEKVHKEQEVVDEKHDNKHDKYAYSMEELDRKIERAHQDMIEGRTIPFDDKFKRYMQWTLDHMEEGVPFKPSREEIPEEFRCYHTK